MSQFVIKVVGYADGRPCDVAEQYLVWYDPNVGEHDQMGQFSWDITQAKQFPDQLSALEEWKRVREVDPVRPWDGKPNRPLTVFTVVIDPVP